MNPRDDISEQIQMAAAQAFRGRKTSYDAGLIAGVGHYGQPLAAVPSCQPYGVRSNPPTDHELVYLQTAAGLVVVTTRQDATDYANLGTKAGEPEDGETVLYNAQGCTIHLDENGDIIHDAKSGRKHKFGVAGGTASRAVAYGGSAEGDGKSSHVASGAALDSWTQDVKDDIDDIHSDLDSILKAGMGGLLWDIATAVNALVLWAGSQVPPYAGVSAPYPTGDSVTPNTTGNIAEDTDHSYVSSGTDKMDVEPE